MKSILLISYYFPPMGMGGTQRVAGFARHLAAFGWRPLVLTVKKVAYYAYDETLREGLDTVPIIRTGSLDPLRLAYILQQWLQKRRRNRRRETAAATHAGARYGRRRLRWLLNSLLIPDQKVLWLPFAYWRARRLLQEHKIDWILTSGPPHSAHLLGWLLHRLYGVRWLADFRDGWSGGDFQPEATPLHRWLNRRLQRRVLRSATAVTAVSEGLKQVLQASEPQHAPIEVITNGYDAGAFSNRKRRCTPDPVFDLVHVGTLGNFVDPTVFLAAFQRFIEDAGLTENEVRLWFIGADLAGTLQQHVQALKLEPFVQATGYISHPDAIKHLLQADLLLYLVTGDPYPGFIPGKTFEYLAARRPILAVCPDIEGLTILRQATHVRHTHPEDFDRIVLALKAFYLEFMNRTPVPALSPEKRDIIQTYSRKALTAKLIKLLEAGG